MTESLVHPLVWGAGAFGGLYGLATTLDALIYKKENPYASMREALERTHKGNIELALEILREGNHNIKENINSITKLYKKVFKREQNAAYGLVMD